MADQTKQTTTRYQTDQRAQAGRAAKNLVGFPAKAATAGIAWMAVMTAVRSGTALICPIWPIELGRPPLPRFKKKGKIQSEGEKNQKSWVKIKLG